jgi:restriction endonuclease S subunit
MWCVEPTKIALPIDILISVRAPVGPTNVADVECCIGRGLAAIRTGSNADRDFVLAALRLYEPELVKIGSGSTFTAINRDVLVTLEIPLPPLPEQRRIAAILAEQLAAVERARAAAAERLIAAQALPAAYLRAVFESEEARGWTRIKLGDAAQLKNGVNFTSEQKGRGILTVDVLNMYTEGVDIGMDNLYRVDVQPKDEYLLRPNDILFVRSSVKKEGVAWPALL